MAAPSSRSLTLADFPLTLNFLPGTQRDGTALDADRALDALWCRWRLGRPRKMGGMVQITDVLAGIPRRIHMYYNGAQTIMHIGTAKSLQQVVIDQNGNFVSSADRTPATFPGGPNPGWTIDALFDGTSSAVQLIAHSVPDITVSAGTSRSTPFIGLITAATPLVPLTNPLPSDGVYNAPLVAGGIVCVQPYLFDFDVNGFVGWSAPNLPNFLGVSQGTSGAGQARISAQKIIAGASLRGGGANSPAALFWSLSELISAQFVGSANGIFAFNTVSPSSSILSGASVIEYDGLYFWAGVDRFLVYNGTVVEVPNAQNQDWFFNNLNRQFAGKTFAFKVPRYGEIWWCAPLFGNTEPSHAIIYNVRENCWYDTALPNAGRGAGYFAQGFPFPVMGGVTTDGTGYSLWLHESGVDQIIGTTPTAIRSYVETPYMSGPKKDQDAGYASEQMEPDIIQSGNLLVTPITAANARQGDAYGTAVTYPPNPTVPQEQLLGMRFDGRLVRLRIESNTLNGKYIFGKNILHGNQGASRRTGGVGNPAGP